MGSEMCIRDRYEALCDYRIENVDLSKAISDVVSAFNAHFGEAVK